MTPIRDYMTGDHRRCDDLFAAVEQSLARRDLAVVAALFGDFCQATLAHFQAEEDFLFPAFEQATGIRMGPTQMMRMEHVQMRSLMDEAKQALAAGDQEDYAGAAETLLILMQQHNMKEENVLYPMCDENLADYRAELLPLLEKTTGGPRS
ncbi:MAG TPA: hemerythrin domain-containing protein [Azospira sp.]|nr:hemerythrin domain-containing protein [Azospira sp.]